MVGITASTGFDGRRGGWRRGVGKVGELALVAGGDPRPGGRMRMRRQKNKGGKERTGRANEGR